MVEEIDKSRLAIMDAAAEWFVRHRDEELSDAEQVVFASWLRASPIHVEEYLAAARLWGDAAEMDATSTVAALQPATDSVVPFPQTSPQTPLERPSKRVRGTRFALPFAVAATVLLAVLVLPTWLLPSATVYATARGEQQTVELADGSSVRLNTATRLVVEIDKSERRVTLVEGEAYFDVVSDTERPFVVNSAAANIRVVGTAFNVYRQEDAVAVTVVEGQVAVQHIEAPDATRLNMQPGDHAIVATETPAIAAAVSPDVDALLAWQEQRLVFADQPLRTILAQFERYQVLDYRLVSDRTGARRFNGVFDANDPDSFLAYLERLPTMRVTRLGDTVYLEDLSEAAPD